VAACPSPPAATAALTPATWRYKPSAGFAGGLVENEEKGLLFLPPDYCLVRHKPGAPEASVFRPLKGSEVAIEADGGCHWAALKFQAREASDPVEMCTHDPAADIHVSRR
jgi:hypothetical protein